MDLDQLVRILKRSGIATDRWGRDGKGTVEELLSEVNRGGIQLRDTDMGLTHLSTMVGVRVSHFVADVRRELVRSAPDLDHAWICDRIHRKKGMRVAMLRRIASEEDRARWVAVQAIRAGVKMPFVEAVSFHKEHEDLVVVGPEPSRRFPGIVMQTAVYLIEWDMPASLYRSEGYQALMWLDQPLEASE